MTEPVNLWVFAPVVLAFSYLIGSIPSAYIIVRSVTGEDITRHGTGNVGAMNVRRSTGSWRWFVVAMLSDALKGIVPVFAAKALAGGYSLGWLLTPVAVSAGAVGGYADAAGRTILVLTQAAVAGAVLGHNYSIWMAFIHKRFGRTGKGLATGGGTLLAYDWRYCLAVVVIGLMVIAVTRYMMAGQVAAALTLPITAIVLRSPDWPFALIMGLVVYSAHHKRFVGLLKGNEPKLYIHDRMGPQG